MTAYHDIKFSFATCPTLEDFANSNAFIRGVMGPFGSGKSSVCVTEVVTRGREQRPGPDGIRRSRWGIVRNCYDDETEILTELRGWKLFKDLRPEDKVAQLNGDHLEFVLPTLHYSAPYKGEMVGFDGEGVNFLVTPDHKMWVSERHTRAKIWAEFGLRFAKDIEGRQTFRVRRHAQWKGHTPHTEAFFEWLGFWFAEGCASARRHGDGQFRHTCLVVQHKPDGIVYARDLFDRAGLPYTEARRPVLSGHEGVTLRLRTRGQEPLIQDLARCGYSLTKYLPDWVKAAPAGHLQAFIHGYVQGDGWTVGASRFACTGSPQLADDLQEIALKAGLVANLTVRERPAAATGFKSTAPQYVLTFLRPTKYEPILKKSPGRYLGWHRQAYDGTVYCVEVPTHVVYVRRRGRAVWCSQTYNELKDTTIKTVEQWFPQHYFGRYVENKRTYTIKAFEKTEIEIIYLALDRPEDVKKLLSLELTGAWVNEAREVPWSVIEALQGRIGRYPAKREGGPSWFGLWLDSNPPDSDSHWYKFFEERNWLKDFQAMQRSGDLPANWAPEDYAQIFKQPSGRAKNAENIPNLPGERLYYTRLAAGKSPEYVKVYVDGQYGFVVDGKLVYPEYSDTIHCKEVDPIEGLPIIRSWDFGLCYSDDTEVLTDRGWKLFKDVDEATDRAASRNPDTGVMEFASIAFKIAEPFKGEMLEWASTELNMLVTPEHRVPFTYRDSPDVVHWQSAEWLADHMGGHHYVDLVSRWRTPALPPGEEIFVGLSDGRVIPARNYAEFMGLYLSEGSVYAPKGKINIYQKHPRPEMQRIMEGTGLPWRWAGEGKAAGWWITNHSLAAALKRYGLAGEKFVPQSIKDMPAACIEAFIWAYTLGDGHVRTRDNGAIEHTVFTTSRRMADDMQELAQKVGWNSSLRVSKPQTSVLDGRTITNGGGYSITFKKRASRAELHRRNFRRVAYNGIVYCLNVPHHTLYVRRKGKPHWNGNTPACVFSQVLPDGRWLTFDEMVSSHMGIDEFSDEVLQRCTRAFRGQAEFEDVGDPAGNQPAQTDARTVFEIMHAKGIDIEPAFTQEPMLRQEAVRKPLRTLTNGEPTFILHPRCTVLRKGFLGGYHRRRLQVPGPERYGEKPDKNSYSHPHDALQYGMVGYFAPAMVGAAAGEDEYARDFGHNYEHTFGDDGRDTDTGY